MIAALLLVGALFAPPNLPTFPGADRSRVIDPGVCTEEQGVVTGETFDAIRCVGPIVVVAGELRTFRYCLWSRWWLDTIASPAAELFPTAVLDSMYNDRRCAK